MRAAIVTTQVLRLADFGPERLVGTVAGDLYRQLLEELEHPLEELGNATALVLRLSFEEVLPVDEPR